MYQIKLVRNYYLLLVIIFLFSCKPKVEERRLPFYNSPNFTPLFLTDEKEIKNKAAHQISAFSLSNQHGKQITDKMMEGKIHIANFIFTNCNSICPIMTANLKQIQKEFGADSNVAILSFSVMPWIDNEQKLNQYAHENQIISKNWHLLTGKKSEIYTLARKAYFAEESLGYNKDSTSFLHTEHLILVDRTKRIRGIYNGTLALETEQLAKDIRQLLKE